MSLEITEEQIASWPPEAQAVVRLLMAEVAALRMEVVELRAESAELRKRLERYEGPKTPQNCSLPPSTQHPHAARRRKATSKRKRGGQPGHRKFERPLIPTEECSETRVLTPQKCRRFGKGLSGAGPAPLRHQVWELPEIKPHITVCCSPGRERLPTRSKRIVNLLLFSAQGRCTCLTPCSGHLIRGGFA